MALLCSCVGLSGVPPSFAAAAPLKKHQDWSHTPKMKKNVVLCAMPAMAVFFPNQRQRAERVGGHKCNNRYEKDDSVDF